MMLCPIPEKCIVRDTKWGEKGWGEGGRMSGGAETPRVIHDFLAAMIS